MKKLYIFISLLLIVLFCGICAHAEFDESTVIAVVKLQADSNINLLSSGALFGELEIEESENLDMAADNDISVLSAGCPEQVYKLTLTNKGHDEVLEAVEYLNSLANIEYAAPNYIYTISDAPDDTYYSAQYALAKVGAQSVWDKNIDCSAVTVAVIDSGIDLDHPDLAANIWTNPNEKEKTGLFRWDYDRNGYKNDIQGWDFVGNDNNPSDENGHGTHVAGIISAVTNNGKGVASTARNAKLVPLRVMNANGQGTTDTIYKAVRYVNLMGFDIVNMSLSGDDADKTLLRAIQSSKALFVCSAGNDASNNDKTAVYPANFDSPNVISVASTTSADTLSYFSNYGSATVDIAAPGSAIYSTYLDGSYKYLSGTSMSCPLVASAAAVVKARYPGMTAPEIIEKLKETADPIDGLAGKTVCGGRLNAYKAILTEEELDAIENPETEEQQENESEDAAETLVQPIRKTEPSGTIDFTENENGRIVAELMFDDDNPPEVKDIRLYIVYRDKDTGELKYIDIKEVTEEMKTEFIIPEQLSDCDITVQVWDCNMTPLMKTQQY